jgi:hypothetical protein
MAKQAFSGLVLYLLFGTLLAHGQFLEAPQYPTGTNPQAMAVGDFNSDGNLDYAVANSGANTVSILLGNGDGTFKPKVDYTTGSTPKGVAVGHFTGSGHLDIAVTNSGSNTVSVLLGNGDGTFQAKIDTATGKGPTGIAVSDFNNDGNFDLVVTNTTDGTVGVLLGKGNGTFNAQVTYNSGTGPTSVAVGDFNNDGIFDLAVANNNNSLVSGVSVFLGNGTGGVGNGTFQGQLQYTVGLNPVSIAVADFNGDKNLDIVVANSQSNTVSVLLGKGNGGFQTHVDYPTGPFPTAVTVDDFDGDGNLDLAVSAGDGNAISVLWGKGDGTFAGQLNAGTGNIPYSVIAGDFNNDHITDLAVANSSGNSVSVVLSNGKSRSFQARTDSPAGATPSAVVEADFNGDGVPDLAVADSSAGTITILLGILGNNDGSFQGPAQYSTGTTNPYALVVGDFNGDKKPDLAFVNDNTIGTIGIMLGNGDGTFQTPTTFPAVGSQPTAIAEGLLTGNANQDLVVANFGSNTVSVLLGNGDGTFQTQKTYSTGTGPVALALADVNGDKKLDLIVINQGSNNISVLLGNGDGSFQAQKTFPTGTSGIPLSVAVQDFNKDGKLDLAVAAADSLVKNVSVLFGNGDGTFQTATTYSAGVNPSSIVIADFNGDGNYDLALTSTPLGSSAGNAVSLLLGNGDGTFGAPTLFGTGGLGSSAAVGDFNADGALDIAVANSSSNTVSVLLNTRGTIINIESSTSAAAFGQPIIFITSVSPSLSNGVAPTGTVTVTLQNGTFLGSGTLASGQASVTTSALPVGSDTIIATYSGDANYQPHGGVTFPQQVNQAGTTTKLVSSANPSLPNQSVTFTATVSSNTSGTPTGSVTFMNGSITLGTAPLNGSDVATFSASFAAVGTNSITAVYSGDGNFKTSLASLSQVVGQASTTTALTASLNTANPGQSVTFTATISSGATGIPTPTGTVTFSDGTTAIGTGSLNASGVAIFTTSTLTAGTHNITAGYGGDANNLASTSTVATVTISGPGFSFSPAPTLSPASVAPGSSSTATVTITPVGGLNPTAVTLSCSVSQTGVPAPTCTMGAISVTNNVGQATLTVSTTGPQAALAAPAGVRGSGTLFAIGLLVPAMLLGGAGWSKPNRRKLLGFCVVFLVLSGCLFQVACSSSGQTTTTTTQPSTPAGKYTVTISGTANGVQNPPPPIPLTLTVQ